MSAPVHPERSRGGLDPAVLDFIKALARANARRDTAKLIERRDSPRAPAEASGH